jgi:short-subunit dehydrogenase
MPVMLAQGTEGHIVNTASPMGFGASELLVIYATSKTCVNTISESLYLQLARMGAPIGVTIVLAAPISTRLYDAYRNRPRELAHESDLNESVEQRHQRIAQVRQIFAGGHPPQEVAEMVLQGIRDNRFYLFTRPEELENPSGLRRRFENILTQRNP